MSVTDRGLVPTEKNGSSRTSTPTTIFENFCASVGTGVSTDINDKKLIWRLIMKSIRIMLLAIFLIVSMVPLAFKIPGGAPTAVVIGYYVGIILFIVGFVMSFSKKETEDVENEEKYNDTEEN